MANKHSVAKRIASLYGGTYDRSTGGPDIRTEKVQIWVVNATSVSDASKQLRGRRGPVYFAATDDADVPAVAELTRGKTVGLMNSDGRILIASTRTNWGSGRRKASA